MEIINLVNHHLSFNNQYLYYTVTQKGTFFIDATSTKVWGDRKIATTYPPHTNSPNNKYLIDA